MSATFVYTCLILIIMGLVNGFLFFITTELEPYKGFEPRYPRFEKVRACLQYISEKGMYFTIVAMGLLLPFVITAGV